MNNRILIMALVLICVILFSGCFSSATKIEEVNLVENTIVEDSSRSKVNPHQSENVNVTYDMIGFDLQVKELLFVLNNSLLDVDIIKLLGEPEKKSAPVIFGGDALEYQRGLYNSQGSYQDTWEPGKVEYQTWYYNSKGIELGFTRDEENQHIVYSMSFQSPCALKTNRGIGIGSTRSEVVKAYEHEINPEVNSIDSESIVAGTVYEGVIFIIENDKVSSIFIGVAPEPDIN